jgi:hypothetical protein
LGVRHGAKTLSQKSVLLENHGGVQDKQWVVASVVVVAVVVVVAAVVVGVVVVVVLFCLLYVSGGIALMLSLTKLKETQCPLVHK